MNAIIRLRNNTLQSHGSQYLVRYNITVEKTIDLALEKGLVNKYNINPKMIHNFKNNISPIPLYVIEAACKLNKENTNISPNYQYLWFCLHGAQVTRMSKNTTFVSTVHFPPCYIQLDENLKNLLKQAHDKLNLCQLAFSELCGFKKGSIRSTNNKVPITVILKICQILNLNIWDILEGKEFSGKTKTTGSIIIPKNTVDVEMLILLTWIRTEGHLELGCTHIEINQKQDTKSLAKIQELFEKKFSLRNIGCKFYRGQRGEDRLIISSSPLRQFLCLKYNLPLGYKTGSLESLKINHLNREDLLKLIPAFIQTEGCLSYHYTRGRKKRLPRFEFVVKDHFLAFDCLNILQKLGYTPTLKQNNSMYNVAVYKSKEISKLLNQTEKYFLNNKKIKRLRSVLAHEIGLQ